MSLISIGFSEDGVEQLQSLHLSRKEAAAYVGVTESGIRDAEKRGLHHRLDADGQAWLDPDDLDAWNWRAPLPSPTKRRSVLATAAKARVHEAHMRAQRDEKRWAEQAREADSRDAAQRALWETEDKVRADVDARNAAARATFIANHLDGEGVGLALGFAPFERRSKMRALVRAGLLREVEPDRELVVRGNCGEPARVEADGVLLVHGGPFYEREDVLRLRGQVRTSAESTRAPQLRVSLPDGPRDGLADLLFAFIKAARKRAR